MENTILEKVKIRLRQFEAQQNTDENGNVDVEIVFTNLEENPIIIELIKEAIQDVKKYRQYPKTFKDEDVAKDLENHENIIVKLVLYDYNKEGAEFEVSNNQNGTSRTYVTRQSILNDVVPFISLI